MFGMEIGASALFGLAAAACWGASDFSGGFASKRTRVYSVVIVAQVVGVLLLLLIGLVQREALPPVGVLVWGTAAGIAGGTGLLLFYQGLATGRMGLVAPVTSIVAGGVPILFGMLTEGLPGPMTLIGFGLALVAVWLISRSEDQADFHWHELRVPVVSGLAFGFFFTLLAQGSASSVIWSLIAARVSSLLLVLTVTRALGRWERPALHNLPVIALAGLLDTSGNAFFALASTTGRLDVASALSSLYAAGTVLLAWVILKERLTRWQWVGVALAALAVMFISL